MVRSSLFVALLALALLSLGCSRPAAEHAAVASAEPEEAATAGVAPSLDPLSYEQEQAVTELLIRKAACDRFEPGFRERSARAFARWRSIRPAEIAAIESRPSFTAQVAEMDRVASAGGGADGDLGSADVLAILESEGRPADRSLATPEAAWQEFLAALARVDRSRALACLSAAGRAVNQAQIETLPEQTLRETGEAFVRFELDGGSGTSRTGTAFRKDGTTHPVVFDRGWNGDWRITSF